MPRYKLTLEYDGTPFAGWQRQKDHPTVQQFLEEAIAKLILQPVVVFAAGRTDAGVHARGQVVHIDLQREFLPYQLQQAVNAYLRPRPIAIVMVDKVDENFHARFSAKKRHYEYCLINRAAELTLEQNRAWLVYKPLNITAMQEAANYLIGTHDFTSFRASQCQSLNPIKTLDYFTVTKQADHILFNVGSKSFLHHQVRNMVGTLKLIGEEKLNASIIPDILASRCRTKSGPTAPACGLKFMQVDY